jgi:ribonuclease D
VLARDEELRHSSRHVIDGIEEVERLVRELGSHEEIAVDFESNGYFRYRPRVCTSQIAAGGAIHLVDTLAPGVFEAFAPILSRDAPIKIVHDAAFDARLLADHDVALAGVFDTSVAARFLGKPALGLATLVKDYFGVVLPKEHQLADWGVRPLSQELMTYLEADVRYLPELSARLRAEIDAAGIALEVAEECAYVTSGAASGLTADRPAYERVKGWRELDPLSLSILHDLAETREAIAAELDVPAFRVLPNGALLELARRKPRSIRDVERFRALDKPDLRRFRARFADAAVRGRERGALPEAVRAKSEHSEPRELAARKKKVRKLLGEWREKVAAERRVDRQVVLPGHCMDDIASRLPASLDELASIEGLGAFRVDRYGTAILELVAR